MERPEEEPIFNRPFMSLMYGAINLCFLSHLESEIRGPKVCAHSSILNSCYVLEAAANCCLQSLEIGGKFRSDLDRLPVLSKFEAFTRISFGSQKSSFFDRGSYLFQIAQELKQLRDQIVHPKEYGGRLVPISWNEDGYDSEAVFKEFKLLGVSRDSSSWREEDAWRVARFCHEFLDSLFREKFKFSVKRTKQILLGDNYSFNSVHEFDLVAYKLGGVSKIQNLRLSYLGISGG